MLIQLIVFLSLTASYCIGELRLNDDVLEWCKGLHNEDHTDQCEGNWIHCRGHCYFLGQNAMNWTDAEQDCQDRDAHLTSVLSQEEQDFLDALPIDYFYIGLTDREDERTWKWTDGSQLKFQSWYANQPDNARYGQDCAVIIQPSPTYYWTYPDDKRWDDTFCRKMEKYVCKKPSGNVHFFQPAQLQVMCSAFGSPKPRIRWMKDAENIIAGEEQSSAVADVFESRITLPSAESYNGVYACIAENNHRQTVSKISLTNHSNCGAYLFLTFIAGALAAVVVGALVLHYLHPNKFFTWQRYNHQKDSLATPEFVYNASHEQVTVQDDMERLCN